MNIVIASSLVMQLLPCTPEAPLNSLVLQIRKCLMRITQRHASEALRAWAAHASTRVEHTSKLQKCLAKLSQQVGLNIPLLAWALQSLDELGFYICVCAALTADRSVWLALMLITQTAV